MKELFTSPHRYYGRNKKEIKNFSIALSNQALLFIPGAFFILLGVVAIMAPMLLVAAVSLFLVFFGVFFVVIAMKFLKFKRKVDDITKQFQGKLYIQGVEIVDGDDYDPEMEFDEEGPLEEESEEPQILNKKIILH